jgi:hypothetical protein
VLHRAPGLNKWNGIYKVFPTVPGTKAVSTHGYVVNLS